MADILSFLPTGDLKIADVSGVTRLDTREKNPVVEGETTFTYPTGSQILELVSSERLDQSGNTYGWVSSQSKRFQLVQLAPGPAEPPDFFFTKITFNFMGGGTYDNSSLLIWLVPVSRPRYIVGGSMELCRRYRNNNLWQRRFIQLFWDPNTQYWWLRALTGQAGQTSTYYSTPYAAGSNVWFGITCTITWGRYI